MPKLCSRKAHYNSTKNLFKNSFNPSLYPFISMGKIHTVPHFSGYFIKIMTPMMMFKSGKYKIWIRILEICEHFFFLIGLPISQSGELIGHLYYKPIFHVFAYPFISMGKIHAHSFLGSDFLEKNCTTHEIYIFWKLMTCRLLW